MPPNMGLANILFFPDFSPVLACVFTGNQNQPEGFFIGVFHSCMNSPLPAPQATEYVHVVIYKPFFFCMT